MNEQNTNFKQAPIFFSITVADTEEEVPNLVQVPMYPRLAVTANARVFRQSNVSATQSRKHGFGWYEVFPWRNAKGYELISVWTGQRSKNVRVHRLVADAFLEPQPTSDHTIDHLDGIPANNHMANLRWATDEENKAARNWQKNLPAERLAYIRKLAAEAAIAGRSNPVSQ